MAVFPIAPGLTDLSSTSSNGITKQIWVSPLLRKNYATNCFNEIANTDIDVQEGDTFVMAQVSDTVVTMNKAAGAKIDHQMLEFPKVELKIDKSAEFSIYVNNVQKKQASPEYVDAQTTDANLKMQNGIDTEVLGHIYSDANTDNTVTSSGTVLAGAQSNSYNIGGTGAPVQIATSNALEYLGMMDSILDEQEAPIDGRFCIVPPVFKNKLMFSDIKNASFWGGDESILANGRLPKKLSNLDVYVNSHLPTATDSGHACWRIIFGVKGCFYYGQQLKEFRDIEDKDYWGVFLQGLEGFGYEVALPENLGHGLVYVV